MASLSLVIQASEPPPPPPPPPGMIRLNLHLLKSHLFIEKFRRIIQHKRYPGYSLAPYHSPIKLTEGDHWLNVVKPGNTGQKDSVSFQTMDGRWIVQCSLTVFQLMPHISGDWFDNACTFWLHQASRLKDLWH